MFAGKDVTSPNDATWHFFWRGRNLTFTSNWFSPLFHVFMRPNLWANTVHSVNKGISENMRWISCFTEQTKAPPIALSTQEWWIHILHGTGKVWRRRSGFLEQWRTSSPIHCLFHWVNTHDHTRRPSHRAPSNIETRKTRYGYPSSWTTVKQVHCPISMARIADSTSLTAFSIRHSPYWRL